MLTAMQFKTFVWPHNPTTYTVTCARRTAVHRVPFGACSIEDLGADCRIMEGSGEFCGSAAYDTFRQLTAVFDEGTPGLLLHPLWQSTRACFTELKLREEPGENHIAYSFRFLQLPEQSGQVMPDAVTASAGDSLWSIAARSGVPVQTLLALNPELEDQNAVTAGRSVRLR